MREARLDAPTYWCSGYFLDFCVIFGSVLFFFIQKIDIDFFVRVCWYFNVGLGNVVLIDIFGV